MGAAGSLRRGVDVIVGTPGRVIDHIERGNLKLSALECVILDEADEMLDVGFDEDIAKVRTAGSLPPSSKAYTAGVHFVHDLHCHAF